MKVFFIRGFLILLSVFLIGWLFYKNLVPSGHFEVVYNFEPLPFISALRPPERLGKISKSDQSCSVLHVSCFMSQDIVGDPVYFDLRLPSSFEKVELIVKHKNLFNQKFTISAFTDRKNWKFITPSVSPPSKGENVGVSPSFKGENQIGGKIFEHHVLFNTAGLDIVDRTITFILGAPEANADNPITIYEIRAIATKQPLKWSGMFKTVGRVIKTKFLILSS